MRKPADEREVTLDAASDAHGWQAVLERLTWLQEVHGDESKYANVIAEDIEYMITAYQKPTAPEQPKHHKRWYTLAGVGIGVTVAAASAVVAMRFMRKK
jgi:hypothetical protein